MAMTPEGNRVIYGDGGWAPFYDRLVERVSRDGRTRSIAAAAIEPGERVILVGVGTGLDLPLLPAGVTAVGVDLSPAMMARAQARLPLPGREVQLVLGDAQDLPVATATFDVAVLHLILSVVPDPRRAFAEAVRAVRPGGRMVIYDKFLADGARPSWWRRAANVVTTRFGTDINRRLADVIGDQPCAVELDEPSALGGLYRVVRLRTRAKRGSEETRSAAAAS